MARCRLHEGKPNDGDESASGRKLSANAHLRRRVMLIDPRSDWWVSSTGCARMSAAAGFAFGSSFRCLPPLSTSAADPGIETQRWSVLPLDAAIVPKMQMLSAEMQTL